MTQEEQGGGLSRNAQIGIIVGAVIAVILLIWLLMRAFGGGGAAPEPTPTPAAEAGTTPELSTPVGGETPDSGESGGETDGETDGGIIIIIPTPAPGVPTVTAINPTNIRGGPSTDYPVVGLLNAGESAEAIGISQDGTWYAIRIPQSPQGSGWIFGELVTGADVSGLPIIVAPPLPTPTAAPPVVITDWRGEYFDNPGLGGEPVLVRNDTAVEFNWGTGSPAPEVPSDNFSARWSINRNMPTGRYLFNVWVDDGVRLWVDGNLIINGWAAGPARLYSAEVDLNEGAHDIVVEYFEQTGTALISLSIGYDDPVEQNPPSARINGPSEGLVGDELVYDGTASVAEEGAEIVSYQWDFGDGKSAEGPQVSYRWGEPNVYNLTLTVTDDRGLESSSTMQVRIQSADPTEEPTAEPTEEPTPTPEAPPAVPVPGIQVQPEVPSAGAPVIFDASDTITSVPAVSYLWDFGDGTTAEGVTVEHIYAAEGPYVVTLVVTDQDDAQGTAELNLVVGPAAPEPTVEPTAEPTEEAPVEPTEEAPAEPTTLPEEETETDTESGDEADTEADADRDE